MAKKHFIPPAPRAQGSKKAKPRISQNQLTDFRELQREIGDLLRISAKIERGGLLASLDSAGNIIISDNPDFPFYNFDEIPF